jgi:hypothetical protein
MMDEATAAAHLAVADERIRRARAILARAERPDPAPLLTASSRLYTALVMGVASPGRVLELVAEAYVILKDAQEKKKA